MCVIGCMQVLVGVALRVARIPLNHLPPPPPPPPASPLPQTQGRFHPLTSPEAHSSSDSAAAFSIRSARVSDLHVEPTTCTALPGHARTACTALSG